VVVELKELTHQLEVELHAELGHLEDLVLEELTKDHNVELEDLVTLEVLIHQKETMAEKIIHHHHLLVELVAEVELVPSDLMHQIQQVEQVEQV
jgi:undecaprenyl pyrophosphate synthase